MFYHFLLVSFLILKELFYICLTIIFFFLSRKGTKYRGKIIQEYWGKQIKTLHHGLGSIKETKILNKENFIFNIFKSILITVNQIHRILQPPIQNLSEHLFPPHRPQFQNKKQQI